MEESDHQEPAPSFIPDPPANRKKIFIPIVVILVLIVGILGLGIYFVLGKFSGALFHISAQTQYHTSEVFLLARRFTLDTRRILL